MVTDGHKVIISHHREEETFRAAKKEAHLGTTAYKRDDFPWGHWIYQHLRYHD